MYLVPVKSKVEISQNFVAFLEYMNFKIDLLIDFVSSRFETPKFLNFPLPTPTLKAMLRKTLCQS